MTLPNFIVIGAQRAGTTLLHAVLSAHDEVFVPRWRKEVHYFDRFYERGPEWYASFFPDVAEAARFRAIGEVTPDYLFRPEVPARIQALLADCRFLVSLRNPVDRAFSGYMHHRRSFNERRPFDEFLESDQDAVARGFYHEQLTRFFALFPRSAFLVLIYEELVRHPAACLERIRHFLGLGQGWPDPAALFAQPINAAPVPRFQTGFYLARRVGAALRQYRLDPIVETAKRFQVASLFGQREGTQQMSAATRAGLERLYTEDIRKLEHLLQREFQPWWPTAG